MKADSESKEVDRICEKVTEIERICILATESEYLRNRKRKKFGGVK